MEIARTNRGPGDGVIVHYRHPGLPADNNITENVIKLLNKKLPLLDGSAPWAAGAGGHGEVRERESGRSPASATRPRTTARTGLGVVLMVAAAALLARDAVPKAFPAHAHRWLAALLLALVAVSYLAYQAVRRPGPRELLKASLLAAAFLFWAANQLMASSSEATLFNDIAIVLFALDVFLVMVGWPRPRHTGQGRPARQAVPPSKEGGP